MRECIPRQNWKSVYWGKNGMWPNVHIRENKQPFFVFEAKNKVESLATSKCQNFDISSKKQKTDAPRGPYYVL